MYVSVYDVHVSTGACKSLKKAWDPLNLELWGVSFQVWDENWTLSSLRIDSVLLTTELSLAPRVLKLIKKPEYIPQFPYD